MNYFELFGFEPAPVVDKSVLSARYFELQKQHHPDFFSQATEAEKENALQLSAAINKAFITFQNEEKTVEYFLQYKGIIAEGEKYQLPPAFLMEMMELNETLDEKDGVEISAEMAAIDQAISGEVKPVLDNPSLHNDPASLEKLKEWYYKKKYLQRILDRLGD
ncbi:MAG: Fe-S protein assembly co-chaperone HscB [Ferruginibacter sp.]